jgi:hypothetical protein
MTAKTINLAPQVRELLLEIAKDPRSSLFQSTPREVVTAATLNVESVSAGTAGWTPAERHLIKAYREELAEALGGVFHLLSLRKPASGEIVGAGRGFGPEVRRRSTALIGSHRFAGLDPGLRATVETIVGGGGREPALDVLTGVICRLRNDHRSANLHGYALMLEQKHGGAIEVLERVYSESLRPETRYHAAVNVGVAMWHQGAPIEQRLPWYVAGAREWPGLAALASIVVSGCLAGREELSVLAAAYLNDVVGPVDPAIKTVQGSYAVRDWRPADVKRLRDLRVRVDGTAARLIDAILG